MIYHMQIPDTLMVTQTPFPVFARPLCSFRCSSQFRPVDPLVVAMGSQELQEFHRVIFVSAMALSSSGMTENSKTIRLCAPLWGWLFQSWRTSHRPWGPRARSQKRFAKDFGSCLAACARLASSATTIWIGRNVGSSRCCSRSLTYGNGKRAASERTSSSQRQMNRPFGTTRTTKIRLALTNTMGQTVYGPTDQQGLFRAHPFPN